MAIPKLKKQNIIDALEFIDEKGVPDHNASVKYALVSGEKISAEVCGGCC